MTTAPPKVEFASLTRLLFHLHTGVGTVAPATALDELLAAFPSLSPADQNSIRQTFAAALPLSADGPGHPGWRPLVEAPGQALLLERRDGLETTFTPLLLHDTLVVDLTTTLRGPLWLERADLPLDSLRPAPLAFEPSLGQCCILYLQAHDHSSFSADAWARAISQRQLVLCGEATLLGRRIWEFSDGGWSWYLWLDNPTPSILQELDGDYQQHLFNVLCCRAKMEFAVRAARRAFHLGLGHYQAIEQRAAQISTLHRESVRCIDPSPPSSAAGDQFDGLAEYTSSRQIKPAHQGQPPLPRQSSDRARRSNRIARLEEHLTVLPDHGLRLARCERDITTHRLTFTTNASNAARAREALLREGDTFFKAFLEEEGPTWLSQMDHDLEVLRSGERYAEQLISALRAVVALDGQHLQRELEQMDKERDRRLQLTIFFVGAALSISGLAAATRPRPAAKLLSLFPHLLAGVNPQHPPAAAGLWLADILIHFLIGCLGAALVLALRHLWLVSSRHRQRSRQRQLTQGKAP